MCSQLIGRGSGTDGILLVFMFCDCCSLDENLVASIQVLAPPDRLQDMKEGIARNMEGVV